MEIRCFYRDRGNTEGNAAFSSQETELKNLHDDLDDHINQFVIQIDQQYGLTLTDCFRTELHQVKSRLAETIHGMGEFMNSSTIEVGTGKKIKRKDSKEQSHEKVEVQTELDSMAGEGEKQENKGNK